MIRTPLAIAGMELPGRLVAAPMAGISDLPFRLIARACGAALVYSEMVSANGLLQGNRSTRELLRSVPEERPLVVQIFGAEPEPMAEAAARLAGRGIDGLDINMGCPVKKVVRKGAGAALLRDPRRARRILRAVRKAWPRVLTVKLRSGWSPREITAPDLARAAEDEGIDAVVIHGRTARQMFSGTVDLEVIRRVRRSVGVPVIGNGDVKGPDGARAMMEQTGCDAVMIGRAALGNPWVFSDAGRAASGRERLGFLEEHIRLMERHLPPRQFAVKLRLHAAWYARGLRGAARFRRTVFETRGLPELREEIRAFFRGAEPSPAAERKPARISGT